MAILSYIISILFLTSFLKNGDNAYLYVGAIFFTTAVIRGGLNDIVFEMIKMRKGYENCNNGNKYIPYKQPYGERNE